MSKKVKLSLIISAILVVVLCGSVGVYVACGYKADDTAEAILEEENVAEMRGYVVVSPEISNGVGFIFYPGANVEYIAYLPLMDQLADRGFTCYLMKMPLNMAIMDTNRADRIFENHGDEHSKWLIGGHSMGGAMASKYASENADKIDGLVLLGAYPYGDYSADKTVAIYGSLNVSVKEELEAQNYSGETYVIEGGNHAYFGNYGEQAGDLVGEISREEQQRDTVNLISLWTLKLLSIGSLAK
jgi:pimeloyl-ACP methyl ester carboxylesterase